MSEAHQIKVLLPDGATENVTISPSPDRPYTITFSGLGMRDQTFSGCDLFEALIALRIRLEEMGCRLLCAGARPDVYPSSMARSMGPARSAYVHVVGEQAHVRIDIFDEARPDQVGTVKDQELFRERWIEALRARLR